MTKLPNPLPAPPDARAIETWLRRELAQQIGAAPEDIDPRAPLADYGLSSRAALALAGRLETWLGRMLAPTLLWEYPTVADLAAHLAVLTPQPAAPPAVPSAPPVAEPIAVIGMACRFPGADTPQELWDLLRRGIDAVGELPPERPDAGQRHAAAGRPACQGGFLHAVDQFDPAAFGISPAEAVSMDPQQRLLLEVAWEACEEARQPLAALAGSPTGVFVGIAGSDYARLALAQRAAQGDPFAVDSIYAGTGAALSIAANRLSYTFDLRGPSLAVDTACSSSLVAVHLACRSLTNGECDLALAGGVSLILAPDLSLAFSQAGMLAPDGRCKTFDAAADGYGRGEGCGIVLLKRLSDALAAGDRIHALICGTAVSQDGRSNGLTAPSIQAQQAVVRAALARAAVAPEQIGYVECHGTGTPLGDAAEVAALTASLGLRRRQCWLSSVKTNIGHLEAAAGIAGLIKAVLVVKHGQIPPHLHLRRLNPALQLEQRPFAVPTTLQPWPAAYADRIAGVSSFGFGGTNAHVVVREPPPVPEAPACGAERPRHVLVLSARGCPALRATARRYADLLAAQPTLNLADLAFSANTGRSHWPHRLAAVFDNAEQLQAQLRHVAEDSDAPPAGDRAAAPPLVAWLFGGQGGQYPCMGAELARTQPTFRRALEECAALFDPHLERPLLAVLEDTAGAGLLDDTSYTQPAIFSLQYALARLWQSWGVEPDLVLGHSLGECAAACVAGALALPDAAALVRARAQLVRTTHQRGAMRIVAAPAGQVTAALEGLPVSIAAANSPVNTVITGERDALASAVRRLEALGFDTRPLPGEYAFHSELIEPGLADFAASIGGLRFQPARVGWISCLTGDLVPPQVVAGAAHWRAHVRAPVRFAAAIETLAARGCAICLEIGPRPSLITLGQQNPAAKQMTWLPSLSPDQDDWVVLLESLRRLYLQGVSIDWRGFDRDYRRVPVDLPLSAFDRRRYWLADRLHADPMQTKVAAMRLNTQPDMPASPNSTHMSILEQLRDIAAGLLNLSPGSIDSHTTLLDLGADSIVLMKALQEIERRFGVRLPVAQLFEKLSTLDTLAAYIERTISSPAAPAAPPPAERPPAAATEATPPDMLLERVIQQQLAAFAELSTRQLAAIRQRATNEKPAAWTPAQSNGAGEPKVPAVGPAAVVPARAEPMPVFLKPGAARPAEIPGATAPGGAGTAPRPLGFSLYFFGAYPAAPQPGSYQLLVESARFADAHDFTALWLPERHFHALGGLSPNPAVLHAALARETHRIALRAGSVVLPLHNPIRVAEEWALVDNLSGGRAGVAFASGWHPSDFALAPSAYGNQHELMLQGIATIQALWRGEQVRTTGGDGSPMALQIFPRPLRPALPTWLAAMSNPKTFALAGQLGVGVLTSLVGQTVEVLAKNIRHYRETLTQHGHDPQSGQVTVMVHTLIGPDAAAAQQQARRPFCDYLRAFVELVPQFVESQAMGIDLTRLSDIDLAQVLPAIYERYVRTSALIGSPASCAALVERLRAAGVDEIACLIDFGLPAEQVLAGLPQLDQLRRATKPMPAESLTAPLTEPLTAPLTEPQRQIWMLGQVDPNGLLAFNEARVFRFAEPPQPAALAQALQAVVDRHEALRTVFSPDGSKQRILTRLDLHMLELDLRGSSRAALAQRLKTERMVPFDLVDGPLVRPIIMHSDYGWMLALIAHHIVADGISFDLLFQEIEALYLAFRHGSVVNLAPAMPFREYVEGQRRYLASEQYQADQRYWLERFAEPIAELALPLDMPRPPRPSYGGACHSSSLGRELLERLQQLARAESCTLFMTLLAGYMLLLRRVTGQNDITIGIDTANRTFHDTRPLVGYCSNLTLIRSQVHDQHSFRRHLQQIKTVLLEAYAHQGYPFGQLAERMSAAGSQNMVTAMFSLQMPPAKSRLGVIELELPARSTAHSAADLAVDLHVLESSIELDVIYSTDVFRAPTVALLAGAFSTLLAAIVDTPDRPNALLPLLSHDERRQLLIEWNQTGRAYPLEQGLPELFQAQVRLAPDAVAVSDPAGTLTYQALNTRANQLAHQLRAYGVGPEVLVALLMARDVDLLVAVLAVFKAGGHYLPLDPRDSSERWLQMLEYSRTTRVLAGRSLIADLKGALGGLHTPPLLLNLDSLLAAPPCDTDLPSVGSAECLAYVLYTSGSTGAPNGAMVTRRGMLNHLHAKIDDLGLGAADRIAQTAPLCFDIAVWQMLAGLLIGAQIHILPDQIVADPAQLLAALENRGITIFEYVPSLLRPLIHQLHTARPKLRALRWLIPTGEALPPDLCRRWISYYPHVPLMNAYGPTECSDDVTHAPIHWPPQATQTHMPIGRPIANTQVYILDAWLQPVPPGIPGELYIGGTGVGRGYLYDPALTADRFIPDPFSNRPGARLYRTGDRARYEHDGSVVFLGRADFQVKISGMRIDISEIEHALLQHQAVREAVVVARAGSGGTPMLVAYLVLRDEQRPSANKLAHFLSGRVPRHMIPQEFIALDALPLNRNGKIDRQRLPDPEAGVGRLSAEIVPPTTIYETQLMSIWTEVLRQANLGVTDDFFLVGGRSLEATQVVTRVRDIFRINLELRRIYTHPTIRRLAQYLEAHSPATA